MRTLTRIGTWLPNTLAVVILLAMMGCSLQTGGTSNASEEPDESVTVTTLMPEKLQPCPETPNCVCSEYPDESHAIPPFKFTGQADSAWAALRAAVESLPRTRIVESDDAIMKAETTSLIFRFVDDLAFRLDADAGLIHVRSASRVGYSDLGANRRRIEELRDRFSPRALPSG